MATETVEGTADGALLQDYASEEGERFAEHKKTANVQRRSDTTFLIRALHMHRLHVHGMYSNATSTSTQRATSLWNMCKYAERCGDRGPVTIPGDEQIKKWLSSVERRTNQWSERSKMWGRRSLPGTRRQTTRSRVGPFYSLRKAIFAPAPRRWALTHFHRSFVILTVLVKKDRKSLQVAAAVPRLWGKTGQILPTFVSFVYVSIGGMSGKHSAGLNTAGWGPHLLWWNQR